MSKNIDHERLGGCYCDDALCYGVRTARALSCRDIYVEHDETGRHVLVMEQRKTGIIFRRFIPERLAKEQS